MAEPSLLPVCISTLIIIMTMTRPPKNGLFMNQKCIDKGLVPALLGQKTFFERWLIFLWPYNLLWLETFVLSRQSYVKFSWNTGKNSSNYEDMFRKSWEPVKLNHRLNTVLEKNAILQANQGGFYNNIKITQCKRLIIYSKMKMDRVYYVLYNCLYIKDIHICKVFLYCFICFG